MDRLRAGSFHRGKLDGIGEENDYVNRNGSQIGRSENGDMIGAGKENEEINKNQKMDRNQLMIVGKDRNQVDAMQLKNRSIHHVRGIKDTKDKENDLFESRPINHSKVNQGAKHMKGKAVHSKDLNDNSFEIKSINHSKIQHGSKHTEEKDDDLFETPSIHRASKRVKTLSEKRSLKNRSLMSESDTGNGLEELDFWNISTPAIGRIKDSFNSPVLEDWIGGVKDKIGAHQLAPTSTCEIHAKVRNPLSPLNSSSKHYQTTLSEKNHQLNSSHHLLPPLNLSSGHHQQIKRNQRENTLITPSHCKSTFHQLSTPKIISIHKNPARTHESFLPNPISTPYFDLNNEEMLMNIPATPTLLTNRRHTIGGMSSQQKRKRIVIDESDLFGGLTQKLDYRKM